MGKQTIGTNITITSTTGEYFTKTNELRFVERHLECGQDSLITVKILQQAWQGSNGTVKWEDVPVIKEA